MKALYFTLTATLLLFSSANVLASEEAKHIPGIFIGATTVDSETDFTFGLEYEYKITSSWGVGAVFERTIDAHNGDGVNVTLASLYYHPIKEVRLGAGIGREHIGGAHPHDDDVYRISAAYEFHLEHFGIAPTIDFDFIDDETAIVYGFEIVMPF